MEWTAGREPYFMHLSEHIAIKGVESLSEGTGEGCGSSLPSHLYPPALKQSCLCQVQLTHPSKTHLQNSHCEQGVLGRWIRGKYIPMHFLWNTSPMIKNHSKNTQILDSLSIWSVHAKYTALWTRFLGWNYILLYLECMTLDKLPNFWLPQFSHGINSPNFMILFILSIWCPAHRKHSIKLRDVEKGEGNPQARSTW